MSVLMGPVLSFRGCEDGNWNLSAVIVTNDPPGNLTTAAGSVPAELLWQQKKGSAHRYIFSFPMTNAPTTGSYTIAGATFEVAIPATATAPRMAYASCNGFSSLKLMKLVDDNNYLWTTMARKHGLPPVQGAAAQDANGPEVKTAKPYHLLLLGGDQVYADSLWETVPAMKAWAEKTWDAGNKATASQTMRKAIDEFYFNLYTDRWSQPAIAQMLARVPTLAMWDDHDLIDGWGSYPDDRQNCDVYDAIWCSASRAFAVFQQHLAKGERRPGTIGAAAADWWEQPAKQESRSGAFSFAYRIGPIAILAVDLRSQRTAETQVVGEKHWNEVYQWIATALPNDVVHLLVMSSIPVIYPGFDTLESLLGFVPGHQDLEDDLRDHWNSVPHKGERIRLVHNLLEVPGRGIRVTLLSGDVHVGAIGEVHSNRAEHAGYEALINQLISSGIVHPSPGAAVVFALQHLLDSEDTIERGIYAAMTKFPGNQTKFIGDRNFVSIEPDEAAAADRDLAKPRLWCNWLVENRRFAYTKVVHPMG